MLPSLLVYCFLERQRASSVRGDEWEIQTGVVAWLHTWHEDAVNAVFVMS